MASIANAAGASACSWSQRAAFVWRHAPALYQPGEPGGDAFESFFRGTVECIVQQDRVARLGRDLGDACTHRAGTDDGNDAAAIQCTHVSAP